MVKKSFIALIFIFLTGTLFAQNVSFEDLKHSFKNLTDEPQLKNLRELSMNLDMYRNTQYFNSISIQHPEYADSFYKLNTSVKNELGQFLDPWNENSDENQTISDISEVTFYFTDFALEENSIAEKRNYYYRIIVIAVPLIFIITLFILLTANRIRHSKKENLLKNKSILYGQENERKRISEELHDTLAQNLKYQKLEIYNLKNRLNDANNENEISELYNTAGDNLKKIRSICQNLYPPDFAEQKFEWICAELCLNAEKKSGIKCSYKVSSDFPEEHISNETRLHLFRIVQEAVNNAVEHSNADKIEINISRKEITISDNGSGFEVSKKLSENKNHFGLRNIKERAEIIGGKAHVISSPDGTTISITGY